MATQIPKFPGLYTYSTCPKRKWRSEHPDCNRCNLVCLDSPHEHIKREAQERIEVHLGERLCTCLTEYGNLGCHCKACENGACTADTETWEDCLEGFRYVP